MPHENRANAAPIAGGRSSDFRELASEVALARLIINESVSFQLRNDSSRERGLIQGDALLCQRIKNLRSFQESRIPAQKLIDLFAVLVLQDDRSVRPAQTGPRHRHSAPRGEDGFSAGCCPNRSPDPRGSLLPRAKRCSRPRFARQESRARGKCWRSCRWLPPVCRPAAPRPVDPACCWSTARTRAGLGFLALALYLISSIATAQGLTGANGGDFGGSETNWLVSFLGGLHPFSVHFPIALVCAAALFETIFWIGKAESAASTAFHCLALGASLSIVSVILGLMASESGPFIGEDAATLWTHRLFGLISCGLLLLTTYVAARSREQKNQINLQALYRTLLYLTTLIVLITGLFGSKLTGLAPF